MPCTAREGACGGKTSNSPRARGAPKGFVIWSHVEQQRVRGAIRTVAHLGFPNSRDGHDEYRARGQRRTPAELGSLTWATRPFLSLGRVLKPRTERGSGWLPTAWHRPCLGTVPGGLQMQRHSIFQGPGRRELGECGGGGFRLSGSAQLENAPPGGCKGVSCRASQMRSLACKLSVSGSARVPRCLDEPPSPLTGCSRQLPPTSSPWVGDSQPHREKPLRNAKLVVMETTQTSLWQRLDGVGNPVDQGVQVFWSPWQRLWGPRRWFGKELG